MKTERGKDAEHACAARRPRPAQPPAWTPNQGRDSPRWDVHLAACTGGAVATAQYTPQTDFFTVDDLEDAGLVTGPGGGAFHPATTVVNLPIVAET